MHGLGGDATDTWTHPKSNAFWLKDFLPHLIPDARVMTFGYNAAAAFGQSTAEVIDHAKSLLSSLIDKRDKPEVTIREKSRKTNLMRLTGDRSPSHIRCTLSWGNCGEAGAEPRDARQKVMSRLIRFRHCSKRGWSHFTGRSAMLRWEFYSLARRIAVVTRPSMARSWWMLRKR